MTAINDFLDLFFSFKAYVMLPVVIFLIALAVRVPLRKAILSTIELAVGFAGVFIAFDFFVANIKPAVEQLVAIHQLDYHILDVGWPPLAAITWASPLAALSIPMILLLNIALLALGLTRTIYIDIWNYWHFAFLGALVMATSGSLWLGLGATALLAIYCFKLTEWTAPDVEREIGIKGVSASPVSVNGIVPYTACMNWLFDRIPVINRLDYNPDKISATDSDTQAEQNHHQSSTSILSILSEPMVIGILIGLLLALAADYSLKNSLELAVHIAAVMFLLPKSAGLIGEAMIPITESLRAQVEKYFPKRKNLVVALDTGFLMSHKSVIVTGLLLMPIAIGIALILPGNKVLPIGDLPNLLSVMSLSVLMFRGNVLRAVLAGIPIVVTFLLIATEMAPLYTDLASQTSGFDAEGLGTITAFTDGGHQVRYLLYGLFQGKLWAVGGVITLLGMMIFTYKRYKALVADNQRG
ncbi:PTS transporter subunit IIC [Gilvimarinus sp. SDUM040013]|uniref:PTS transporter subunit IIC n=1 Tax=Gilvimarinus gilvus TaxID=3058038 RepID=A0ABU4S176_9GAMM|nr:PTS transporter subunit IIC [Gilvimarinus sp. SDUM040013]MDO3387290.1 PTS transporter subunit IIC [Gilvimarinus sp. SDUM040013]MDX6848979.1 PTS transporter subunit IIC [Gilvimarinus sp. SDUM040013]